MDELILRLNVHIPPGDKSAIQELVHTIQPEWKKDSITVTPIPGGVLNEVWKCSDTTLGKHITVKVHGKLGNATFNRSNEQRLLEGLSMEGLHPIRCFFNNGYAYDYVVGDTPTVQQFRQPDIYEMLIKMLHQTHMIDCKQFGVSTDKPHSFMKFINVVFAMWTKESLEKLVLTERYKTDFLSFEEMREKLATLPQMYETLCKDFPACFIHQDMHIANTVYDPVEGKLSAVDWESAGFASEVVDIAIAISRDTILLYKSASILPGEDETWMRGFVLRYLQTHPAFSEQDVDEQLVEKWLYGVYKAMYMTELCLMFAALASVDKFDDIAADYYGMALECFKKTKITKKVIEEMDRRRQL